jgi:(2Fe-2S) ferredoxin
MSQRNKRIWVCIDGPHCAQRNPKAVFDALRDAITEQGASDRIEVCSGGCVGMCGNGPNALLMSGRSRTGYSHLVPADAKEIIAAHADGDKPVERLRLKK